MCYIELWEQHFEKALTIEVVYVYRLHNFDHELLPMGAVCRMVVATMIHFTLIPDQP